MVPGHTRPPDSEQPAKRPELEAPPRDARAAMAEEIATHEAAIDADETTNTQHRLTTDLIRRKSTKLTILNEKLAKPPRLTGGEGK